VAVLFPEINDYFFQANTAEAVVRTFARAAGEIGESGYAAWLKANSHEA